MMFHLFFLTITISKRQTTENDVQKAKHDEFIREQRERMHAKHADVFRRIM